LSGLIGVGLYHLFETSGYLPGFWLAIAVQCLLLPVIMLLVGRRVLAA